MILTTCSDETNEVSTSDARWLGADCSESGRCRAHVVSLIGKNSHTPAGETTHVDTVQFGNKVNPVFYSFNEAHTARCIAHSRS